jgi:hypothetical protein
MFNMLGVFMLFLMIQMWLREDVEEKSQPAKNSAPRKITHEPIGVITRNKAC